MIKEILVFGYNEYAKEITSNFIKEKIHVHVYVLDEASLEDAKEDGIRVELVELDDDWLDIEKNFDINEIICFCALDDDAQNVFLTISLRAEYENIEIISLATSKNSADKLRLAGANKAIPKLETVANLIVETLEKPAVVEALHEIFYRNKNLKLAEYRITETSVLNNTYMHEVKLHEEYNVIILAIANEEIELKFSFTAHQDNHKIKKDDVLAVIGIEKDLEAFEKAIL